MSASVRQLGMSQVQQQVLQHAQKSFWGGRMVIAGLPLPQSMPKEIGFKGWAKVVDERLEADGYILYAKDCESLQAVAEIQAVIDKPVMVRYTVGTMKKSQLEHICTVAEKLGITSFLFCQGEPAHRFSDIHTGVVVTDALDIFKDSNKLLACDVPLPSDAESNYLAKRQFAEIVRRGCNLGILSCHVDQTSNMDHLERCREEGKIELPAVLQKVSPATRNLPVVQKKKAQKISFDAEAEMLTQSFDLAKKRVTHLGAFVDLSQTHDDDFEDVMRRMKGVTLASTMD